MCWSLSLIIVKKKSKAIQKKYGHMKVQVLKKRKNVGTSSMKKKKKKKKIAMLSKEFI